MCYVTWSVFVAPTCRPSVRSVSMATSCLNTTVLCLVEFCSFEPVTAGLRVFVNQLSFVILKGKGKGLDTCYSAAYMSQTRDQQCFAISEVAADWHEPMVPQRIMWPYVACANRQLNPRCSYQTHHRLNQRHLAFTP